MSKYIHFNNLTPVMRQFIEYWYIDVSLEQSLTQSKTSILAPFYNERGDEIILKTCTTQIWTPAQIKQQRQLHILRRTLKDANRKLERVGLQPSEQRDIAQLYGYDVC